MNIFDLSAFIFIGQFETRTDWRGERGEQPTSLNINSSRHMLKCCPQSYDGHLDMFLTVKLKMYYSVYSDREFNDRCYREERIIHVI